MVKMLKVTVVLPSLKIVIGNQNVETKMILQLLDTANARDISSTKLVLFLPLAVMDKYRVPTGF